MSKKPTSRPTASQPSPEAASDTHEGDRIAKVLSRAGVASRREAERMIAEGRVKVNGTVIDSPALNVTSRARIEVDDAPLPEAEAPRLWLYYKPIGLVSTNSDEKGRETLFDRLPDTLPRVMTVGRLDINSEGLLLLTNDGGIKRQLELPSTGWLRRYRVRINGRPQERDFEPLRKGLVIDGERFQPMQVTFDRQQGANAWVTIGLREGKNREIRRAMEDIGYQVNRLLRISYGPFQLGDLKPGDVEELRSRVVRDQLGLEAPEQSDSKPTGRPMRSGKGPAGKKPFGKGPVGKSAGKFGTGTGPKGKSAGRPDSRYEDRPTRNTDGRSAHRSAAADPSKPLGSRGKKHTGKPTGKPSGKPAGKSYGRPSTTKPGPRAGSGRPGSGKGPRNSRD